MNKKVALIILLRHSFLLPDETKLALLGSVETMTTDEVEELGSFLSAERAFVLENEQEIQQSASDTLQLIEQMNSEKVYVGSGKPS